MDGENKRNITSCDGSNVVCENGRRKWYVKMEERDHIITKRITTTAFLHKIPSTEDTFHGAECRLNTE